MTNIPEKTYRMGIIAHQTIQDKTLSQTITDSLKYHLQQTVGECVANNLKWEKTYDEQADEYTIRATTTIIGKIVKDSTTLEINTPRTWIERYKLDNFPEQLLEKFPIEYNVNSKTFNYERSILFPDLNIVSTSDNLYYHVIGDIKPVSPEEFVTPTVTRYELDKIKFNTKQKISLDSTMVLSMEKQYEYACVEIVNQLIAYILKEDRDSVAEFSVVQPLNWKEHLKYTIQSSPWCPWFIAKRIIVKYRLLKASHHFTVKSDTELLKNEHCKNHIIKEHVYGEQVVEPI